MENEFEIKEPPIDLSFLSEENEITFSVGGIEVIKLVENGDIYIKGNLAENDKEVVNAMREFLNKSGLL